MMKEKTKSGLKKQAKEPMPTIERHYTIRLQCEYLPGKFLHLLTDEQRKEASYARLRKRYPKRPIKEFALTTQEEEAYNAD